MVIAVRFHLFPFRTEKLSSLTPMVLHLSCGRVGSRLFKVRPYGLTFFVFRGFPRHSFSPLSFSFLSLASHLVPFPSRSPLRCGGKMTARERGERLSGLVLSPPYRRASLINSPSDTETAPESPHDAPILLRRLSSILRRRSFKVRLPKWGLFEAPARTRPICKHGSAAKVPTVGRVQRLGNPTEYKCI